MQSSVVGNLCSIFASCIASPLTYFLKHNGYSVKIFTVAAVANKTSSIFKQQPYAVINEKSASTNTHIFNNMGVSFPPAEINCFQHSKQFFFLRIGNLKHARFKEPWGCLKPPSLLPLILFSHRMLPVTLS